MKFARSIYLGGEIIEANDSRLNNQSYKDLGLYCPQCGEEVHLRYGSIKEAYFAHFKKTTEKKCNFRVEASNNNTGKWTDLEEGRGQRRILFQKHFLYIITINAPDFFEILNTVELFKKLPNSELLITIIKKTSFLFIAKKKKIKSAIINHFSKVSSTNNFKILQEQIILEVIEYLSIESSSNLLEQISSYCIYNCQEFLRIYLKNEISELAFINKIIKTITCVDWIKYYFQITKGQSPFPSNKIISKNPEHTNIRCPYCIFTFTKERFEAHLQESHDFIRCSYCLELINKSRKEFHLKNNHIKIDIFNPNISGLLNNKQIIGCLYCKVKTKGSRLEKHILKTHTPITSNQ